MGDSDGDGDGHCNGDGDGTGDGDGDGNGHGYGTEGILGYSVSALSRVYNLGQDSSYRHVISKDLYGMVHNESDCGQ